MSVNITTECVVEKKEKKMAKKEINGFFKCFCGLD